MCDVVSGGLRLDEHVIHLDLHGLANLFFEHHIDETLVGYSCILKTKRHDLVIVEPAVCDEGSVFLIGYMHWDLVVS